MLARFIKKLLRISGYEISKIKPDPFTIQKKLTVDSDNLIIFDVGAHHGETAKIYAESFPQSTIYSFEPFEESFKYVCQVAANYKNIKPYCLAISDSCGMKDFYVNQLSATNSLLPRPESIRRYYLSNAETLRQIRVENTTLDRLCEQLSIERINILKMDIQGGELQALKGANNLLKSGCIDLIYTEAMFVPHYERVPLFYELCEFLYSYGYSVYDLFLVAHGKNGQLRYGDVIFVSSKVRTEVVDACPPEP